MGSAAARALLLVLLALGGLSSGAAMAGVQLDPIGTVTSAISTIASQTTVVSDLTGSATSGATSGGAGSGATDAVSGATDVISGTGALSASGTTGANSSGADGGSGSASSGDASSGSAASNRRSPHTRFDRLPRRYEKLLEQIESGRNVRANIARLRALLASASPELRARVMRLIRLEIRTLEKGGLTRRERGAVQRLRGLLTTLQGQPRSARQGPLSLGRVEGSGILSATASGGVEPATAGSESRGRPPTSRDGASNAISSLPLALLPPPAGPSYLALLLLVLAALACLVLLLTGAPRHLLPSHVQGMVEVRRPEVLALAVEIGLGLLVGVVAWLLVQAVLL